MAWVGPVAGIASSILGANSAGKAADAQQDASEAAIAEQRRQYDQSRGDQQPYMGYGQGQGGLAGLAQLDARDLSGFLNSPELKYQNQQMLYGLDHSAAAKGSLFSGGHDADRMEKMSGLASQQFGNYTNRLQWGAALGQNAASGLGSLGANAANQIGHGLQGIGDAKAQGYGAQAGMYSGVLGGLANYANGRNNGSTSAYQNGGNGFGVPGLVSPYAQTGYGGSGSYFGNNG